MDVAKISIFFVLVAVCSALKSWEIPPGNLLDYVNYDMTADWIKYKKEYNKTYSTSNEELKRRYIWEDNKKFFDSHNRLYEQGKTTFTVGENDFSDMAEDEFEDVFLRGLIVPENLMVEHDFEEEIVKNLTVPYSKDWKAEGKVTPVRNQGQCGSCWAFSAVGAIESAMLIRKNRRVDLSEQNLVDCAKGSRYRCYGCRGGWMNIAFQYIQDNGGINTERDYPYRARDQHCRFKRSLAVARLARHKDVPKSERALKEAVGMHGPVCIAANVNNRPFWSYKTGVYNYPWCSKVPTHAMLAVGYGAERGGSYWLVKNSWGTGWGHEGYIKMARDRNNQCGIASFASYPVLQ